MYKTNARLPEVGPCQVSIVLDGMERACSGGNQQPIHAYLLDNGCEKPSHLLLCLLSFCYCKVLVAEKQ